MLLLAPHEAAIYYVVMYRVTRRLRVGIVTVLCILLGSFPVYASATTAPVLNTVTVPDVIITEFQTNGGTASQEFIEFYNTSDKDIWLDDSAAATSEQWKIQFFNSTSVKSGSPTWATATSSSNSISLKGVISAHDYFVLSSTGYEPGNVIPDQFYDPTSSHLMTDTGGGLQLLSTTAVSTSASSVHDRVMWLDPVANPVMPSNVLSKPATGKSLQRIPNDDDEYIGADSILTAFAAKDGITPLAPWQPPVQVPVPQPEPTPESPPHEGDPGASNSGDPTTPDSPPAVPIDVTNAGIVTPMITELLPNPASPQTDAADEFIEVYNPNSTAFDLKGYSLEVGTTTLHKFSFTESIVIPAMSYRAFYSVDTHLSLSNSGGQARLRGLDSAVVSETAIYDAADDNTAWALADGVWRWTTTPTPGAFNLITIVQSSKAQASASTNPAVAATKVAVAKKAVVATKAAAKPATTRVKGVTTTKKAATKLSAKKKAKTSKISKKAKPARISTAASVKPKPPIHPAILVAVAATAVLYGLYEYRHDISNKFVQFRENRAARRSGGSQAAWRRGYSTE